VVKCLGLLFRTPASEKQDHYVLLMLLFSSHFLRRRALRAIELSSLLNDIFTENPEIYIWLPDVAFTTVVKNPHRCSNFGCIYQSYTVWVKKNPPLRFSKIFLPNGWEFLINISHTYYTFLSMLGYKFLVNYLQLWRSYTTKRDHPSNVLHFTRT